jgi:hypothetical protein
MLSFAVLAHIPPAFTSTSPVKVLVPLVLVILIVPDIVVDPSTVRLKPPILNTEDAAMLRFIQEPLVLRVTVRDPSIKTLSELPGTLAPEGPPEVADHIEVEFQLPLATQ